MSGNLITGTAGADYLNAGTGDDTLDGAGGPDSILGGIGNNLELGGAGNDFIMGGPNDKGNDSMDGGAGDDFLRYSPGADTINGGEGIDRLSYAGSNVGPLTINLATGVADDSSGQLDTVISIERVNGTGMFADHITGSDRDETLSGNGGNDTLDGGGGFDVVGYGSAQGGVSVSLALGSSSGADGVDVLSNFEGIDGGIYDDLLIGNDDDNLISGQSGNDTLVGGGGNDTLQGGAGNDVAVYSGNRSDCLIYVQPNGDTQITDVREGQPDGTDLLRGIQSLQFADVTLDMLPLALGVSGNPAGHQTAPATALLTGIGGAGNNGSVVVFRANDDNGEGIYARRIDREGNPVGNNIPVNTTTAGDQRAPAVSTLYDGGFVVVWESNPGTGLAAASSAWDIKLQRYDADGQAVGDEVDVNTTIAGGQRTPQVTPLRDGGYLVVWSSRQDNGGADSGIYGQRYDASGAKVGGEVRYNSTVNGEQYSPFIDFNANNPTDTKLVLAWSGTLADGSTGYAQQLLDGGGNKLGAEQIVYVLPAGDSNAILSTVRTATAINSGEYALAWTVRTLSAEFSVMARFYNSDGTPKGEAIVVASGGIYNGVDVIESQAGQFMLVWGDASQAGSTIVGRNFNTDGTAAGAQFVVSDDDQGGVLTNPVLSLAGGGGIQVNWAGTGNAVLRDSGGVYQQVISPDGQVELGVFADDVPPPPASFTVQTVVGGNQPVADAFGQYALHEVLGNGAVVYLGHLALSGNASYGSTVTVLSGDQVLTTVGVDDGGHWSADLRNLAEGPYQLRAVVTDIGGLSSPSSDIFDITVASAAVLEGTAGNDGPAYWLDQGANDAPQTLNGGAGNDTLDGAGGADTLNGGAGNDVYIVRDYATQVNEAAGEGVDTVRTDIYDYHLPQNVENLDLGGSQYYLKASGNDLANVITGSASGDFYGMGGNDTIIGGNNSARMDGGAGNDVEIGGDGYDQFGSLNDTGNDSQSGGASYDSFNYSPGSDTMDGGADYDYLTYRNAPRAQTINLATGLVTDGVDTDTVRNMEYVVGSKFSDKITGGAGNDYLIGIEGDDTIDGGAGIDGTSYDSAAGGVTVNLATGVVSGGAGNDRLSNIENVNGSAFNDNITGDAKANTFYDNAGDDLYKGAGGNDYIFDYGGLDTAVYSGAKADYTISTNADGSITVQDKRSGSPDGTDTLRGIDKLQFSNGTVELKVLDHVSTSNTAGTQTDAALTVNLNNGNLMIGYRQPGSGGDSVYVRALDAEGIPQGTDQLVLTQGGTLGKLSLAFTWNNVFVLVYQTNPQAGASADDPGWDVMQLILDANGAPLGEPTLISSNTVGAQVAPALTVRGDGSYVVTWQSQQEDGGGNGIYAQAFTSGGERMGEEVHINSNTAGEQVAPSISTAYDGYTIAWQSETSPGHVGYAAQFFDWQGQPSGGEIVVAELDNAGGQLKLGALAQSTSQYDNSVLMAWVQDAQGQGDGQVMMRAFSHDGTALGDALLVADGFHATSVNVKALYDGGFMVVWSGIKDGQSVVMGRHYDVSYVAAGPAFAISRSAAAGDKLLPELVDTGNGVTVLWETGNLPGLAGGGGIYQQSIDYNGNSMYQTASAAVTVTPATTITVASVDGGDHPQYDPAAPVPQYLTHSVSNNATVGSNHLVLSGAAAFGSTVEIKSGATVLGTVGVDDSGKWVLELNHLAGGAYHLTAVVRDVNGVASAASAVFNLTAYDGEIEGTNGNDDAAYWAAHGAGPEAQLLSGGLGSDTLVGHGNDTLDGGAGKDWADYSGAGNGVTVNLATGTANAGSQGSHTLLNIEYVAGSAFADSITGSDGDDLILGGGGNDTLDGGAGTDLLSYYTPFGGDVQVSLQTGVVSGAQGQDLISNFENVIGSSGNDFLEGDHGANVLDGFWGNDSLRGGGGDDTLNGGAGYDQAYYSGNQDDYTITSGADGVVVVSDKRGESPDGTDHLSGIDQLHFADGVLDLTPTDAVVSSSPDGPQWHQDVTALDGGGYVIAFRDDDVSGSGVSLRVFNEQGVPLGDNIVVGDVVGDQRSVTVVRAGDGGFFVAYNSNPTAGVVLNDWAWENYLQRFDAAGNKIGEPQIINTTTDYSQRFPMVTALKDGSIVASWISYQPSSGHRGLYTQRFDEQGNKIGTEHEAGAIDYAIYESVYDIVAVADGYVIAWSELSDIRAQRFDMAGNKVGAVQALFTYPGAVTYSASQLDLAATADGGFVAAWTNYSIEPNNVMVQSFNAQGQPAGSAMVVPNSDFGGVPSVVGLPGGGFAVAWENYADGQSVLVQRYDEHGAAAGEPFRVNQRDPGGNPTGVVMTILDNGKLLVSWGELDAMANNGLYQQIVDWNGHPEFFSGSSDQTPPAAPAFLLQQIVGGGDAQYTDTSFGGKIMLHDPLSSGAAVGNGYVVLSGTGVFGQTIIARDGEQEYRTGVDDSGHWSIGIWQALANGEHAFVLSVRNAQGVEGPGSTPFLLTVDNSVLNGSDGDDAPLYWADQGASGDAQVLNGGAGDDTMDGRGGNDTLNGGDGNDLYILRANETVIEAAGGGIDTIIAGFGMTLPDNVENLTVNGPNGQALFGNALDNVLNGTSGGDMIGGGDGNDSLYGNDGNDVLFDNGADDDLLDGGAGNDWLLMGRGHDTLEGGAGKDILYAANPDQVHGVAINLASGEILDNGFGESGSIGGIEVVMGTRFGDHIIGSNAGETFLTHGGNDTIEAGGGNDTLMFGDDAVVANLSNGQATDASGTTQFSGVENLTGSIEGDVLTGDGGANVLRGLAGNDTLAGGGGNDTLIGGAGNNRAVFSGNKANYSISTNADGAVSVQDLRGGSPDGIDNVQGIKTLQFADGTVELTAVDRVISSAAGNFEVLPVSAASSGLDGVILQLFRNIDNGGDKLSARLFDRDGNPLGGNFAIGAESGGEQRGQVVTALQSGGFAVAYHSNPVAGAFGNNGAWEVKVQLLDGAGQLLGGPITVNTTTDGSQRLPAIVALEDGGFVVTWQSTQQDDGPYTSIYARTFNAFGEPLGPEVPVSISAVGHLAQPTIAALPGGYVILWSGKVSAGSTGLMQQYFDEYGNKIGDQQLVHEISDPNGQVYFATQQIAATGNGGHVVSWVQDVGIEGQDKVMVRNYDVSGNPVGAAFAVASGSHLGADVLGLSDGSYMVVWDVQGANGESFIMGRRYSGSDNSPLGGEFKISQSPVLGIKFSPTLTEFQDGEIVVSWGGDGSGAMAGSGGVYQQIIDFDGNPMYYAGTSSTAKPAATTITVQTVTGGQLPEFGDNYSYLVSAPLNNGAGISNSHLVLSGTAAFGSVITIKSGANVLGTTAADDDGRWVLDLQQLAPGNHALTATVRDVFGKVSDASAAFNLVLSNSSLTGTAGADGLGYWYNAGANNTSQTLNGQAGNDTLDGGGGKDTLIGGAGDDTYYVNDAGVVITEAAGGGTDTVVTSITGLTLAANVENLVLADGPGLQGIGNALNNLITGGSGNDTLNGGAGADTLAGGAGNDAYVVDVAGDVVQEGAGGGSDEVRVAYTAAGTYVLSANVENAVVTSTAAVNLTGNALDNYLQGNAAANVLIGNDGADTLAGEGGNDTMIGGAGNDFYKVDAVGDVVTEAADGGIDTVSVTATSHTLAANVENLSYVGTLAFNGSGNALANVMYAGSGNDTLNGGGGNDTLWSWEGNDSLLGGDGNDVLNPGVGVDFVDGGAGADLVVALGDYANYARSRVNDFDTKLVNTLTGETITIRNVETVQFADETHSLAELIANSASSGADVLTGTDGNDRLDGGAGADTMSGGLGDDTYVVDNSGDLVIETGDGVDLVEVAYTAAGTYTLADKVENATITSADTVAVNLAGNGLDNYLVGNGAANKLSGNAGNDTLLGGAGNDTLLGGDGSDMLIGGGGNDSLAGGAGNDVYLVNAAGAVITELADEGGDLVNTSLNSFTLGANLEALVYSGSGAFNGIGNELNNNISGGIGNDTLAGNAGNDYLQGGGGNDSLSGGIGDDALYGGDGNDVLNGGAGGDLLSGGSGNDTIDGGEITDRLNYSDLNFITYYGATAGISVNLATGVALDGLGGTDKLTNINYVQASIHDDSIVGSSAALLEIFEGLEGDDTIDGGAITDFGQQGNNLVTYTFSSGGVVVDLAAGTADSESTGHDTLLNINQVRGSNYDDTLLGSDSALREEFEGRGGIDVIDGRGGIDMVHYDSAGSGVMVDLVQGIAVDGDGSLDELLNIEGAYGSSHNDNLFGGAGNDIFVGNGGSDLISGGAGYDLADYSTSTAGVNVDLSSGTALDGLGGTDLLLQIELVRGSSRNDTLLGSNGAYESFEGRAGDDHIDGRGGVDRVDYQLSKAGVTVNLQTGVASDGEGGTDTLLNIEQVVGSTFNDSLSGDAGVNYLSGMAGNDTLSGGAGEDLLDGGAGNDSLLGGDGDDALVAGKGSADVADGGAGSDVLTLLGNFADYARTRVNATDLLLVNGITGESVTVRNVEQFEFNDGVKTLAQTLANITSIFGDVLVGDGGNDTLNGGAGADTMSGGAGDDSYVVDVAADVIIENVGEGTDQVSVAFAAAGVYTLSANIENATVTGTAAAGIIGNELANQLSGNAGANVLTGNGGNDTLNGGAGNDSMSGGAGDDVYVVDAAGDVVTELAGAGNDSVLTALASYTLSANVEKVSYTGSGSFKGVGNELNNVLTGGAGNDTLSGAAGWDNLDGGNGNDSLSGDDGWDFINGGAGNDVLNGGKERDYLWGGAGNDTIDGGAITDRINFTDSNLVGYDQATVGVSVNLATGVAQDGQGGTDKLININIVWGSIHNDTLVGSTAPVLEIFGGGAGDDTIDGGAITGPLQENNNQVSYEDMGSGVAVDLQAGTADGEDSGHDTLLNINYVVGSYSDDELLGSDSGLIEHFNGMGGNDTIDGRAGFDFVHYEHTGAGVVVNLATGEAMDGYGGTDTLRHIEGVVGSWGNDLLTGGNADNDYMEIFVGNEGNDTIDGAQGYDRVEYGTSTAAVLVDLATGTAADGMGGTDTLLNIEGVSGSAFNDTLNGSDGEMELFEGGAGNDVVDGRGGYDVIDYERSKAAVVVNLATGTATDGLGGTDKLISIEEVFGSAFNDSLTGSAGDDCLQGLAGNDTLIGGAGNDTLFGGLGNDSVAGGDGNDTLRAGTGVDVIDGGAGSDQLQLLGNFLSYTITRPNATDVVLVNAATGENITLRNVEQLKFADGMKTLGEAIVNSVSIFGDYLVGDGGANSLNGGAGSDTMVGGAGNDTYTVDVAGDVVTENPDEGIDLVNVAFAAAGTYTLAANVENATVTGTVAIGITGNALDNVLTGNAVANKLDGGAGNDTLIGGAGNDSLVGGLGDDVYVVDVAGDVVTEAAGAGSGIDRVETALATYTLAANVENLVYTGSANFSATGNASDNQLTGGAGKDTLNGGLGNDTLSGGAGDDSLLGGDGNDVLNAGTAVVGDLVDGGNGSDTLKVLGAFEDYVRSRPTATDTKLVNVVTGESITLRNVETVSFDGVAKAINDVNAGLVSAGNDTLTGTSGADSINGGTGSDLMIGLEGDDIYEVDVATDAITELDGGGIDLVNVAFKAAGTYVLSSYVDNATVTAAATIAVNLTGNAQNNVLTGNAAVNTLIGDAGDDTLDGGAGADKLTGGTGNDVYMVDVAGDVVTELADGGTDTVQTKLASYTLGANVENLVFLGTGAFTGTGNALANKLTGGVGNDSLVGGLGNDTLDAGTSGAGDKDVIDGGGDVDTLAGLEAFGNYKVSRPNATDTVLTHISGGVITVRGVEQFTFDGVSMTLAEVQDNTASTGSDTLVGTDGADSINGGAGADSMSGGAGDDIYVVDVAGDIVVELADQGSDLVQVAYTAAGSYTLGDNIENATVTATVAVNLIGNALDNTLIGNAAANMLSGGLGNDTLIGGAGNDTMVGGGGDDVYVVDVATDVVTELDGGGTDSVQTAAVAYTLGAFVENLSYTGTAAFAGTGNALANAISGGIGKDTLSGGGGNDTLTGGAGDDSLLGGDGDDSLSAGTGVADVIDGGAGTDLVTVLGNFAAYTRTRVSVTDTRLVNAATGESLIIRNIETVHFADGDKALADLIDNAASPGADTLVGTTGNDIINGLGGIDVMSGGEGDDTYVVDVAGDVVTELADEGTDLVQVAYTAPGSYTLGANVENGTVTGTLAISIVGNELDNVLTGNAAANKLTGNAGNDTLISGGGGNDTLIGGDGDDVYVIAVGGHTVTEALNGGTDVVRTVITNYSLATNVENLIYTGTAAFTAVGNLQDNDIRGGIGNDKLDGAGGNDTLTGGLGNDTLTGGTGNDTFVLAGATGVDTITDFSNSVAKGFDKLAISQAALAIGNGDTVVDGGVLRAAPGGFAADAELVIFSSNSGGITPAAAALVIGSANSGFTLGQQALFVVDNNSASYVYLFKSSGTDALVSADELTQIAILTGNPATTVGDYLFVA
ncbi:Ig-like domain-containing protein [Duganella sp. PWIR1]